ncbi:MAG: glycosyltransferase family 4 protein [Deltaproteobacteria bacterium]|uniref:Glycosyltransferase family 4 protein n=1 Tax=Candidatus Zymogenus saltonus TaxID=2844893 RepID=A0A9D8K975_9DELT|nr:glycosyltransferase family 4 protein [Candidatus Zymogenus saltonus]
MGYKVAFVIDKFDPARGGAEGYARDLCRGLADRGFEVHVLARVGRTDDERINIHIIPAVRYPKFLRLYTFVEGVEREIERGDYDIVHAVGYNTGINVLNPHSGVEQSWIDGDDNSRESGIGRRLAWIKRLLSPRHHLILSLQRRQYGDMGVKAIIAIAEMVKRDIVKYHNVDEKKIEVVYNGVDMGRFSTKKRELYRAGERERLGIGEDEIIILLVSNNFRLKGVLPAIELLPVLRERAGEGRGKFRLMVVGRDNPRRYLRVARRLEVDELVRFIDYVPDLVPLYAAADIYFHPTFYDSCSLTVIEALASGLPVVTTEKNGASGLIESKETGWVIDDPRNKDESARALLYYFDDGLRKRAHRAAERFGERLSFDRNIDRVVQIYDKVVSLSG